MLRCASFFAGVGGIDKGFENNELFKVVYANEFDPYPVRTYELNSRLKVDCRDIREIKADEIPDFDVLLAGFPCQAFSVAGYRKGFEDEKGRGTLFFELIRIIEVKNPQIVFLENVKNLVGHDGGNTFKVISEALKKHGYFVEPKVLNAMEYGNTPQNRERIYIVCFKDENARKNFQFPQPMQLKKKLDEIIDFNGGVDEKYYYREGKYKGDIYEKLVEAMDDDRAVYQWRRTYVRKNKSGVVPTLTANQGEGGHNVCLIKTLGGIRKMTPHECFNAQGFPEDFKLPDDMSDARLYKQAGNSVCVSVIERIADEIANAYNKSKASESAKGSALSDH
ncbi:MAG: DNA cytosine methyltransferase [Lachnospiraceae bacterium]|nr:DNA cytosine methyltransferase [Lachnospiraceae bacterium]